MKKKGQLTMFVILGIVILGLVLGYVLLFSDYAIIDTFIGERGTPESFMINCVEGNVKLSISNFLANNLYLEPVENNYFKYNNNDISEIIPIFCTVGEFNAP